MTDSRTNADLDAEVIALDQVREACGPMPPALSDEALAMRFAELHRHDLRYVAAWGRWLVFDGMRWRFDDTLAAFDRARRICREGATECKDKSAARIASAKTVVAVERLAKADRRPPLTSGTPTRGFSTRPAALWISAPGNDTATGPADI